MRYLLAAVLLCVSLSAEAQIPQPIRETSYDWRCVGPAAVVSNHSRLDTALYACQVAAAKSPGVKFYVEGGRYRIEVPAAAPPPPPTGSATLSWVPPIQNTDGSQLTDLAAYKVRWGSAPGTYPFSMTINQALSSYVVDGLSGGTWYFVVTAINSVGVESVFSNVASKTISF